ncbi:response regulator transcription factor [Halarcobacter anaerophilus]|jgi:DNA-binding response OmpR family regulator|uniref:DNA-binding response regulator n=2 Tax=Halarcobacter anaerophilus TaxID=877500 RepID=A0A4Q0XXT9_9BACT|nr:response regulator transcription factor [Halarcobacter anaerophilus]QDF28134.1 two-component system response regulator [Halarcobacter anaerophilus]RXJ62480.1 DNA-binding response regulator [Halarcobacter anaerophilus]
MKIFLLEDDYSLNTAIKESLELENHNVESFYDGLQALDSLSSLYDLYILDINTPTLEGISLIESIKRISKKIKVIMISAIIDIDKIRESYNKGCDDYLKKPFDIEELLLKIKKYDLERSETNIELSKNIHYSLIDKKFYINNKNVHLTKNEQAFLHLLILNKNSIVTNSQIEDYVYEGESKTSVAIRSMVKRLRKKLSNNIIETVNQEGFIIHL